MYHTENVLIAALVVYCIGRAPVAIGASLGGMDPRLPAKE